MPRHLTEVLPGAHELLLGGGVLGPFLDAQLDADQRHPRWRAHPVVDGLLEPVAVADATEVRHEQLGHAVVAALERGGQAEPLVVLAEHRPSQRRPPRPWHSSAMSSPPAPAGGTGLYAAAECRVATSTSHDAGQVLAAVAQPADPSIGQRGGEPTVPLLHEHPGRHHHEHEAAPAQRVGGGRDRDVGLPGAGDGLDHAPATAPEPAHERVELPPVELVTARSQGS